MDLVLIANDTLVDMDAMIGSLFHRVLAGRNLHIFMAERYPHVAPDGSDHRLLAERSYGDELDPLSGVPYRQTAHRNLLLSVRTGLPSREVQLMRPGLLVQGDGVDWGSAVVDNLVVACAGPQPHYCERISYVTAHLALARVETQRIQERTRARRGIYED